MSRAWCLAVTVGALVGGAAMAQGRAPVTGAGTAGAADAPSGGTVSSASAEDTLEVGLRTGYAVALGDVEGGASMSALASGMVPIELGVGYRLASPGLLLGGFFQYGIAFLGPGYVCGAGSSCTAGALRFGVQAQYHLVPTGSIDPWIGLGLGYESLTVTQTSMGQRASAGWHGWELANLEVGGDFKTSPRFSVGPVLELSFGEYAGTSFSEPTGGSGSEDITEKALHLWLSLGLRGVFDLELE